MSTNVIGLDFSSCTTTYAIRSVNHASNTSNINESNAYAGVAILLHTKHVKKNIRVHRTSGRVIGIDFKMYARNYCAISTYVPHCGYAREDFDDGIQYQNYIVLVSES